MLAYVFHFQPSQLWSMDADDLAFWASRAGEIQDERRKALER